MTRLSPARAFALACLEEVAHTGRYVREVAESSDARPSDVRDAALGLRLALSATAAAGTLDELLDRFLAKPRALKVPVRLALRLATCELLYLGTPAHVVVSQGVELVRSRSRSATGLANAVLRRVAEARASFLRADDIAEGDARRRVRMAREAGLPVWLVEAVVDSVGEVRAGALCAAALEPAPVAFHLNPQMSFPLQDERLAPALSAEVALPGLVVPQDPSAFIRSSILDRAGAVASDAAAQLIATAATASGRCLEVGAGRGTKTFIIAAQAQRLGWTRTHVALELHARKGALNLARLSAAGLAQGVTCVTGDGCDLARALAEVDAAQAADGSAPGAPVLFDRVLVDAPCSGTGTMRRHPEIPWRLEAGDVSKGGSLPALQLALLREASRRVAPAGELLYATCSVLRTENHEVVQAFLESPEGAAFHVAPLHEARALTELSARAGEVAEGTVDAMRFVAAHEDAHGLFQTVPAAGACDGHFCARLVRAR